MNGYSFVQLHLYYMYMYRSVLWSTPEQTGIILCDSVEHSADVVFFLHRCLHSMKLSPL